MRERIQREEGTRGVGIGVRIFGDGGFSDYQLIKQN